MGTTILLSGTIAGGVESGLASIDVPANGLLVGYDLVHYADLDADGDNSEIQISFGSAFNNANDSRQLIGFSVLNAVFVTSGRALTSQTKYVSLPDLQVGMGERIYVHSTTTASTPGGFGVILHFDFELDRPRVRLR